MNFIRLYEKEMMKLYFRPSKEDLRFLRKAGKKIGGRVKKKLIANNGNSNFSVFDELKKIWQGSRVLDLGCGTGEDGVYLLRYGIKEYIGVDIYVRELLERSGKHDYVQLDDMPPCLINQKSKKLKLIETDWRKIDLSGKCDVCLNIAAEIKRESSINHLDEMLKYIKDGGILIFSGHLHRLRSNLRGLMDDYRIRKIEEYWVPHRDTANSKIGVSDIYQVCWLK